MCEDEVGNHHNAIINIDSQNDEVHNFIKLGCKHLDQLPFVWS
jgi:hypothetical protein